MDRTHRIAAMLLTLATATVGCGGTPTPTPPDAESTPTATAAASVPPALQSPPPSEPPRNPSAFVEGTPYAPTIDPADFVSVVDNPYFPLTPGTTYVFEGGTERIEVVVTHERRTILGVATIVVHDRVWDDGELIEDTLDWYAQDRWGNVWYFGEATQSLESGVVVDTKGSWEAGVDGAQPGVVMLGDPKVGDVYRQEFYAGEAEDVAKIVRIGGSAAVTAGLYDQILVTEDWTPLEPDVAEEKTYAQGVGFIFERFVRGGEGTIELIEVRTGG